MRITGLERCLKALISLLLFSFFWKFQMYGEVNFGADEEVELTNPEDFANAVKNMEGHSGVFVIGMETTKGEFKTLGVAVVGKSTLESGQLGYVPAMIAKIAFKWLSLPYFKVTGKEGKVFIFIKEMLIETISSFARVLITWTAMDFAGFWFLGSVLLLWYALIKVLLIYCDETMETDEDIAEMQRKLKKKEERKKNKIEKRRKRKEAFQQFRTSMYIKLKALIWKRKGD